MRIFTNSHNNNFVNVYFIKHWYNNVCFGYISVIMFKYIAIIKNLIYLPRLDKNSKNHVTSKSSCQFANVAYNCYSFRNKEL